MTSAVDIHPEDISICHRLKRPNSANSNKVQHCPLLVKFTNRKARSAVLAARSQLKGSNIDINEHLTTTAVVVFAAARKLVKSKKLPEHLMVELWLSFWLTEQRKL